MSDKNEINEDENLEVEDENSLISLEEIVEELEDVLCSMEDLADKIAQYQTANLVKGDLQVVLKKITEFCCQQSEFSGLLDEYL